MKPLNGIQRLPDQASRCRSSLRLSNADCTCSFCSPCIAIVAINLTAMIAEWLFDTVLGKGWGERVHSVAELFVAAYNSCQTALFRIALRGRINVKQGGPECRSLCPGLTATTRSRPNRSRTIARTAGCS